jgi:hypothetical protein
VGRQFDCERDGAAWVGSCDIVSGPLADPKFAFYKNGHTLCCPVYLPGNGGLLLSVALLAGGSDTSSPMYFPAAWQAVGEGFDVAYP